MCAHNQRERYCNGFYCNDCNRFIGKDSPEYRQGELLSSIWIVLWNINAERRQNKLPPFDDVAKLVDEIGIGKLHANYEELIAKAEVLMAKYGKNSESATLIIG